MSDVNDKGSSCWYIHDVVDDIQLMAYDNATAFTNKRNKVCSSKASSFHPIGYLFNYDVIVGTFNWPNWFYVYNNI